MSGQGSSSRSISTPAPAHVHTPRVKGARAEAETALTRPTQLDEYPMEALKEVPTKRQNDRAHYYSSSITQQPSLSVAMTEPRGAVTVPDAVTIYGNQLPRWTVPLEQPLPNSSDRVINSSREELFKFLITHASQKPKLTAHVRGYVEHVLEDSTDHQIIDIFELDIDMTGLIGDSASYTARGGWHESLDEYLTSRRPLKEIVMTKHVEGLDLGEVKQQIEDTIRSTGFSPNLEITLSLSNDRVRAFSSSPVSKFANDPCVACLCVASCLCIVFAPIYFASNQTFGDGMSASYKLEGSPKAFVESNKSKILDLWQRGRKVAEQWKKPLKETLTA